MTRQEPNDDLRWSNCTISLKIDIWEPTHHWLESVSCELIFLDQIKKTMKAMWENNHLDNRKKEICPNIATDTSYHAGNQMAQANHLCIEESNYPQLKSIGISFYPSDLTRTQWWSEVIKLYYLTKSWHMGNYLLARKHSMRMNIPRSNKEDCESYVRKQSSPQQKMGNMS